MEVIKESVESRESALETERHNHLAGVLRILTDIQEML